MRYLIITLILIVCATISIAQEGVDLRQSEHRSHLPKMNNNNPWINNGIPWMNNGGPNIPNYGYYNPPLGFRPQISWFPEGSHLGIGPVVISPDRRYVRFGISAGFYGIPHVNTFNYYNGR